MVSIAMLWCVSATASLAFLVLQSLLAMQDTSDAGEAVLPLMLRFCDTATTCSLLCASQATAAVVHSQAPCLNIIFSSKLAQEPHYLSWLAKNAVLLRRIKHQDPASYSNRSAESAAAKDLAAALAQAASLPSGLRLVSLQTWSLPLLSAASCTTLTHLDLSLDKDMLFPSVQETAARITGLGTHLRSLKLYADWVLFDSSDGNSGFKISIDRWKFNTNSTRDYEPGQGLHSLLQQVLPRLSALTRLEVAEVADASLLKHAPPQLLQLHCMGVDDQSNIDLELGHLTALTLLKLTRHPEYEQEGWRVIQEKDVLPPNLKALEVTNCTSATPLLPLTKLTRLAIGQHCQMPAAELQRLSSLTQLRKVHLGYNVFRGSGGEQDAMDSSGGWGSVPALCDLELHRQDINPGSDLLKHLAGLTALTRLVWDRTYFCCDFQRYLLNNWGQFSHLGPDEAIEQLGDVMFYNDGGLTDLGSSLPTSLRTLELGRFVPALPPKGTGGGGSDGDSDGGDEGELSEAAVVRGLKSLQEAIAGLPHLDCFDLVGDAQHVEGFSEEGQELVGMVFDMMLHGENEENGPAYYDLWMQAYDPDYSDNYDSDEPDSDAPEQQPSSVRD